MEGRWRGVEKEGGGRWRGDGEGGREGRREVHVYIRRGSNGEREEVKESDEERRREGWGDREKKMARDGGKDECEEEGREYRE